MFSEDDPFTGTDLDGCVENTGEFAPWAQEIVTTLDSYTNIRHQEQGCTSLPEPASLQEEEPITPKSTPPADTSNFTGDHLDGTPATIQTRQEAQETLYHSLDDQIVKTPREMRPRVLFHPTRHDEEVLAKAIHARNAERFLALWEGKTEGFRSKSEADFTLVLYLLYWTNDDTEQTKRLFRQSGLYDPEKTDTQRGTQTYLDVTVENALRKRRRP